MEKCPCDLMSKRSWRELVSSQEVLWAGLHEGRRVDYAQKWVHADMKTVRHAELAASEEFFKKIQNTTQDSAAAYAQLPHSCFKHQVSPFLFEVVGSSEWAFIHPSALVPFLSSHSLSTKHLPTWSTTPPHSLRSPLCPQGPGGRVCNVILAPQPMGSLTHMFHHWKHRFHCYQREMDLLPSFFFSKVHL